MLDWQQWIDNLSRYPLHHGRLRAPVVSLSAPESLSEPRRGVRAAVCHEGPLLIRTAHQRIMGLNNVLASSPNESGDEILEGGSPGRGTLIA